MSVQYLTSTILSATGHAAVTWNNGVITWATETIKDIFGWDAHVIVGRKLYLLYANEGDYQRTVNDLTDSSEAGLSQFQCRCKKSDGTHVLCDVSVMRLNGYGDEFGQNLVIYKNASNRQPNPPKKIGLEQTIKDMQEQVQECNRAVRDTNNTLRALVDRWESDKKTYLLDVSSTVKRTLLPLVEEMKKNRVSPEAGSCMDLLESRLRKLADSAPDLLASRYPSLSDKELRVADLIRDGKTTKEIAKLFHITPAAVDFHRSSIRKKLGLKNRKMGLKFHLRSPDHK